MGLRRPAPAPRRSRATARNNWARRCSSALTYACAVRPRDRWRVGLAIRLSIRVVCRPVRSARTCALRGDPSTKSCTSTQNSTARRRWPERHVHAVPALDCRDQGCRLGCRFVVVYRGCPPPAYAERGNPPSADPFLRWPRSCTAQRSDMDVLPRTQAGVQRISAVSSRDEPIWECNPRATATRVSHRTDFAAQTGLASPSTGGRSRA